MPTNDRPARPRRGQPARAVRSAAVFLQVALVAAPQLACRASAPSSPALEQRGYSGGGVHDDEGAREPHFPRVDALTRTLELCKAVQAAHHMPIACAVHEASGVQAMTVAFAALEDVLEYGSAVNAELAVPFCTENRARGQAAMLVVRVGQGYERELPCVLGSWGEARPNQDDLMEVALGTP